MNGASKLGGVERDPVESHTTENPFPCDSLTTGTHQVVVQRDPYDNVAEQLALGLLAGMAAGAAMRSFLWMPFLFC